MNKKQIAALAIGAFIAATLGAYLGAEIAIERKIRAVNQECLHSRTSPDYELLLECFYERLTAD